MRTRRAALDAAANLLEDVGFGGFTVDEVARRSKVSKSTIYRHWSGGLDLAVEAYGGTLTAAVPVRPTGDAVADLTDQVVRLAGFYAGPRGRVVAQLLGAAALQDGGTEMLRDRFFADRRADTVALVEHGQRLGQLRDDVEADLVVDLLFAPIVFRLFDGLPALTGPRARTLAGLALDAVTPRR